MVVYRHFFSGLIFLKSFERAKNAAESYGANMYGAFIGGLFENAGMIIGINGLTMIAIAAYFLALYVNREKIRLIR